jgi:Tfp pilus assembly protein PilO
MLAIVIVLGTRFALDWVATSAHTSDMLASKQVELKALQLQTAPLRGLDKRVGLTRDQIKDFYGERIPANNSSVLAKIGSLEVKSGVRLSRVQYSQGPSSRDLAEISMDAGVTGQYAQIMQFINSLERDKTFFVIRAMGLTGQQGGMVNLRLRVSTWLRPENVPSGLPPTGPVGNAPTPLQESPRESNQEAPKP